jgi:lysophospholipase L1-like esterase
LVAVGAFGVALGLDPEFLARRASSDGTLQPYTLQWLGIYRMIASCCAGLFAVVSALAWRAAPTLGPTLARHALLMRKLAVAGFALVLAVLALESTCRLLEMRQDVVRQGHDFEAEAREFMRRVAPQQNADGFRDESFDRPRAGGERRVLVIGDSFAFGFGIDDRARTFPAALEAELSSAHPTDVFNAGVPGADSERELAVLEQTLPRVDPDLVLLAWFVNDAESNACKQEYVQQSRLLPLISDVLLRHSALWRRLEPALVAVCVRCGAKASYLDHLRRLYDAPSGARWSQRAAFIGLLERARHGDRHVAVVLFPLVEDFDDHPLAEVHTLLRATCAQAGVPCFDLHDVLRHEPAESLQTSALDHHLNEKGCALAARAVARFVAEAGFAAR